MWINPETCDQIIQMRVWFQMHAKMTFSSIRTSSEEGDSVDWTWRGREELQVKELLIVQLNTQNCSS